MFSPWSSPRSSFLLASLLAYSSGSSPATTTLHLQPNLYGLRIGHDEWHRTLQLELQAFHARKTFAWRRLPAPVIGNFTQAYLHAHSPSSPLLPPETESTTRTALGLVQVSNAYINELTSWPHEHRRQHWRWLSSSLLALVPAALFLFCIRTSEPLQQTNDIQYGATDTAAQDGSATASSTVAYSADDISSLVPLSEGICFYTHKQLFFSAATQIRREHNSNSYYCSSNS
jgi:hypothetical protein